MAVTTQDLKNLADSGFKLTTSGSSDAATVKLGNTVKVVDGANTKVSAVTSAGGTYSFHVDVTDLPMAFINSNGAPLVNIGGKFYNATDIENGQPKSDTNEVAPAGIALVDKNGAVPADGQKLGGIKSLINDDSVSGSVNTPTVLHNVADGKVEAGSKDAVNGNQLYEYLGISKDNPVTIKEVKVQDSSGKETTVKVPVYVDKDGKEQPYLKTYNVSNQSEYLTNDVYTAIHNINEQGTKFFHVNAGQEIPPEQAANTEDSSAAA